MYMNTLINPPCKFPQNKLLHSDPVTYNKWTSSSWHTGISILSSIGTYFANILGIHDLYIWIYMFLQYVDVRWLIAILWLDLRAVGHTLIGIGNIVGSTHGRELLRAGTGLLAGARSITSYSVSPATSTCITKNQAYHLLVLNINIIFKTLNVLTMADTA